MKNRWFLLFFIALPAIMFLSSCYYHGKTFSLGPVPKDYISIITNIKPFKYPWKGIPSNTTGLYIISIDGKKVPRYFQRGRILQEIEVYPGKHIVEVRLDCGVRPEICETPTESMVFEVNTKPGRTYLIDARIDTILKRWKPIVVDLKEVGLKERSFM